MERKYIINIIFIILILIILVFNQHPWFKETGRGIYFKIWEIIQNIWQRIQYLFNKYVLSKILGEKEGIETELESQKETAKQEIGKAFSDFIQNSKNILKSFFQNIFQNIF